MVTPSYKPAYVYGGPTRAMADLCENLVKAGHQVQVYTTDANGADNLQVQLNKNLIIDGVQVQYHHRWTKDHTHFSPQLLWRLLRDIKKFDAVHLISWWNLVTMPALMISILRGVRPILSVHGTLSAYSFQHRKSRMKKFFQRLVGNRLLSHAILHVTTEKEKEEVESVLPKSRLAIIPNFINFPPILNKQSRGKNTFQLLFVGRLDAVKNIEFLIDLLNEDWDIPIHLDIMGEGTEEYTSYLHQKTIHNNRISWLGNLDGEAKWSHYANADLLVLPSRTENFGNVVIEALSQGTPVLLSDQVGLKEYVTSNQLGWVAKTDPQVWKKILQQIWSDLPERERIRKVAPLKVEKDFNEMKLVDQYVEQYQQAIHFRQS
jgi:glycosyltransferase involved in cell wall biosynthesis